MSIMQADENGISSLEVCRGVASEALQDLNPIKVCDWQEGTRYYASGKYDFSQLWENQNGTYHVVVYWSAVHCEAQPGVVDPTT